MVSEGQPIEDINPRRPSIEQQQMNKTEIQKRRQNLLLMSPMLVGYSLKLKKWRTSINYLLSKSTDILAVWMSIDNIRPIAWNEDAYDHLVFPVDQKDLLLAFVRNHTQSVETKHDVIAGKGGIPSISVYGVARSKSTNSFVI